MDNLGIKKLKNRKECLIIKYIDYKITMILDKCYSKKYDLLEKRKKKDDMMK